MNNFTQNICKGKGKTVVNRFYKFIGLIAFLLLIGGNFLANAQTVLFSQDFNNATSLTYTAATARALTSASGNNVVGTNTSSQFTSLSCVNKTSCGLAINDATYPGALYCGGGNTSFYWSFVKSTNFATTAPTAIKVVMNATYNIGSSSSSMGLGFAIGSGFTDALVSTASQTNANVHSGFFITNNSTPVFSTYSDANTSSTSISTSLTGTISNNTPYTYTWVINNTGALLTYTDPAGGSSTLADDKWDLWVGTVKKVSAAAATTTTQSLQNIYIGNNIGKNNSFKLDDITVTDLTPPPTGPTITGGTTSTTAFTTTFGTASAAQTFTIGGTNLGTTSITATAPTGFEVSSDGITYGSTATFAPTSGTVSGAQLRVRLAASANVGLYNNNNIVLTSGSATAVNITTSSSGNEVFSINPFISSNPTSVAFGFLKNNTSSIQSFNILAGNLTPPADNITVTAPTGYLVSTSSSGGFASSITVPYSSGTLASTPIYVKFTPTQSQSYTGNILLSGGGATSSIGLTGTGSAYAVGTYKSNVITGNWLTPGTWVKWDGVAWQTSTDYPNSTTADVYISGGNTVTYDPSAATTATSSTANAKSCNNLFIDSNSTLKSTGLVNSVKWLNVYGNTVSVESGSILGNTLTGNNADGICINVQSNNLTITGGGTISISRIITNIATTNLIIDANVTLNYHGSGNAGNAAGFYIVGGDNNTLTVNAGKTLTFAPWSCLLYTSGSHSTTSNFSQNINLYGTMTFVDGDLSGTLTNNGWAGHNNYFSMNVNGTATSTLNVYNGGTLNVSEFYPNGTNNLNTPGAGNVVTINVANGGKINVSKIADFRNTNQTVTGGGEFNLLSGATMKIGATTGISASSAAGPIQTTTRGFNVGATYSYEGTSAQVTGDGLPSSVSGLTINNSAGVTLSRNTDIIGKLTLTAGLFNAGNYLTLKSTSSSTASVAPVLGSISGNVTVERYIPAKRAYRALTSPVNTTNSIRANWQENGTGNTTNGFDIWSNSGGTGIISGGSGSSLLSYNSSNNTWSGITDTTTSSSLLSGSVNKPFMAFVTGPYGTGNVTSGATATTVRATGALFTGNQTYANTANQYTFIGNPYASPLDLTSMLNDTDNAAFGGNIWVWDANATGLNSVGTYNLFNNGTYTNVTSNPVVTSSTQIQSGQAFFVKSAAGGTFTIKEAHKGTAFSNAVFRTAAPELLRVGLYKQVNNEWSGRDGAMTVILSDAAANQEPNKMANGTENIAFTKNGANFASNHHLPLVASDVLNVKVWNTTAGANYKLKINTEEFTATNLNATLEDLYTNSRTPLTLDGSAVEYPFTVTTDALSSGDRFRIVFQSSALGMNNPTATSFSIVPNPVTGDAFQVNLGSLATGTYSYSICNAIGQEVAKGNINNAVQNTNYEVKMSNSATGIYIMKIKGSDNSVYTAKIIKK